MDKICFTSGSGAYCGAGRVHVGMDHQSRPGIIYLFAYSFGDFTWPREPHEAPNIVNEIREHSQIPATTHQCNFLT